MKSINRFAAVVMSLLAASSSCALTAFAVSSNVSGTTTPDRIAPEHVVVVIFENHSYANVVGNTAAPTFTALADSGANFVNSPGDPAGSISGSHALRHPSQPNYMELYSGNSQG